MFACRTAGLGGGIQACLSLVHSLWKQWVVSEAQECLPHLFSACNRITMVSDDNIEMTNGCDSIKRESKYCPLIRGLVGMV